MTNSRFDEAHHAWQQAVENHRRLVSSLPANDPHTKRRLAESQHAADAAYVAMVKARKPIDEDSDLEP